MTTVQQKGDDVDIRSNVAEFKRLDRLIVDAEADVQAAKWKQARLAFEATTGDGAIKRDTLESPSHHLAAVLPLATKKSQRGTPICKCRAAARPEATRLVGWVPLAIANMAFVGGLTRR